MQKAHGIGGYVYNPIQLEKLLRRKYGEVRHQSGHNGLELVVKCPVCGKRKLNVNPQKGIYKCWHGCMSGLVRNMFADVELVRNEAEFQRRQAPKDASFQVPGELVPLAELPAEHPAIAYLRNRGFDPAELDRVYGMRYCRSGRKYMHGMFDTTNTIVIPFYFNGVAVGWQSRLLYNPDTLPDDVCEALGFDRDPDNGKYMRPPKYFTMPGIDKGTLLWNFDWARRGDLVVVCEGVFDAMAVGRCAVATFGKSVTAAQIALLKSYWKLVVLLLDPGDAEPEMIKISAAMSHGGAFPVYVMLKGYKDAGEAPRMEIWRQIDEAVTRNPELAKAGLKLDNFTFLV